MLVQKIRELYNALTEVNCAVLRVSLASLASNVPQQAS